MTFDGIRQRFATAWLDMDVGKAKRFVICACLVNVLALVALLVASVSPEWVSHRPTPELIHNLYLFFPWILPFSSPAAAVLSVAVPTNYLCRLRPAAARYFALFYLGDRCWCLPWLYVFSTNFIVAWVCVSLMWAYIFVQAFRGALAYDRARRRMRDEAPRASSATY